jgi:hypothetical protein
VLIVVGVVLVFATVGRHPQDVWAFPGFQAAISGVLLALATLLISRWQENRIGWIFLCVALLGAVQLVSGQYAYYALAAEGQATQLANIGAWVEAWIWVPIVFGLSTVLLVLFPTGDVPSRRWWWVVAIGAAGGAAVVLATSLMPGLGYGASYPFRSPFAIDGADDPLLWLYTLGVVPFIASMGVALLAMLRRLVSADAIERRQLEWIAAAGALVPVALIVYGLFPSKLTETIVVAAMLSIPAAAAVAIMRYRLYDIDVIVNRTLVYVPLTGILAGLYTASVALFQRLFVAVTGNQSDAAIVLSALVLASAFTTIRNALQAQVDRRFKQDTDAAGRLSTFATEVESSIHVVVPARLARRYAERVVEATGAAGASITVQSGDRSVNIVVGDAPTGEPALTVPLVATDVIVGELRVGERRSGRPYREGERLAIAAAGERVADAIDDAAAPAHREP